MTSEKGYSTVYFILGEHERQKKVSYPEASSLNQGILICINKKMTNYNKSQPTKGLTYAKTEKIK